MPYESQSARDAQSHGQAESYCRYLDDTARRHRDYFLRHGDPDTAASMMTRSWAEALMGNEGD